MTQEEHLREERQALNAAINNRDLKKIESHLGAAFVANTGRRDVFDKQAVRARFWPGPATKG